MPIDDYCLVSLFDYMLKRGSILILFMPVLSIAEKSNDTLRIHLLQGSAQITLP